MVANHSSPHVHYWAGRHPGSVGWLLGPSSTVGRHKTRMYPWMSYALDNDAFYAYTNGTEWNEGEWFRMLEWMMKQVSPPRWILMPDKVGDKEATIEKWHFYREKVNPFRVHKCYRFATIPLAFAVQDGMEPEDVPADADVVFVGGSFRWKRDNLHKFVYPRFKHVHVGRVNTLNRLYQCRGAYVDSVDGTGWFRHSDRMEQLHEYIGGKRTPQTNQIGLTI